MKSGHTKLITMKTSLEYNIAVSIAYFKELNRVQVQVLRVGTRKRCLETQDLG